MINVKSSLLAGLGQVAVLATVLASLDRESPKRGWDLAHLLD